MPDSQSFADSPAFVAEPFDRAEAVRENPERLAALRARPDARVLPFWRGKPGMDPADPTRPARLGPDHAPARSDLEVFLGLDGDVGVFAAALPGLVEPAGAQFEDLRTLAPSLSERDAGILATARALLVWHHRTGFCARCGTATAPTHAGWRRQCPACGTEAFPRVEPVAIMAIEHAPPGRAPRLLIGRQPGWPPGFASCLAGFVEPGESVEASARREALEEAGVAVGAVRLLSSQPWPFPGSLMIGVWAEALDDAARPDGREIEALFWIDREDALAMLAGDHPALRVPPPSAIAHHLIARWARGAL